MSELENLSVSVATLLFVFMAWIMYASFPGEIHAFARYRIRPVLVKYLDLAFTAAFMAVIFQLVGRLFH